MRHCNSRKKSLNRGKVIPFLLLVLLIGIGGYSYARHTKPIHQTPIVDDRKNGELTPSSHGSSFQIFPRDSTESQQSGSPFSSPYDNLALGIPGKADTIIDRPGYALGYIEYHEQPAWVVYRMTEDEAVTKAAKRNDNFREDPQVPTGSATLADYRRSGYDRGHLAPAADMAFSVQTMKDSFYMSNMSPQKPQFNRGIWKELEAQIRHFAIVEKDIYVVTGPVLPETKSVTIGASKVTVPAYYYKVVYDLTPPEKMIGFLLPNEGSSKRLEEFAVTVDTVEKTTGLDFFKAVPQPKQEQLESTISIRDWWWQ